MKRSSLNQSQTTVGTGPQNKREEKEAAKKQKNLLSESDQRILSLACNFARKFNGECLSQTDSHSTTHISMIKGQPSIKFKCGKGHVFYKPTCELFMSSARKFSFATAASSSHNSDNDDSDDSDKTWCPKCVAFFRNCQKTAKHHGFTLQGKLFGSLAFRCAKSGHLIKISYSRRLTGSLNCTLCQKQDRERIKAQLREEEQQKESYFARMQEECF